MWPQSNYVRCLESGGFLLWLLEGIFPRSSLKTETGFDVKRKSSWDMVVKLVCDWDKLAILRCRWFVQLALVIGMVVGIHCVEAYLLNPVIYASHLKLHPLMVLSVLVIAEHSLGVWGLLLAGESTILIRFDKSYLSQFTTSLVL